MNNIFFAWLDYETGGLNGRLPNGQLGMDYYPILEVALIVTDGQLHQVGEPLRLVINHSEERIAQCSEWAIETHTKSGLLDEVRASKISLQDAEHAIISHLMTLGIKAYDKQSKTGAILAGSSIQFDRSFMMCQMPELNDYLHYRQLDVSTFNIAVRQFAPHIEEMVKKEYKHEALADIQETINEFKVYQQALFDNPLIRRVQFAHSNDESMFGLLSDEYRPVENMKWSADGDFLVAEFCGYKITKALLPTDKNKIDVIMNKIGAKPVLTFRFHKVFEVGTHPLLIEKWISECVMADKAWERSLASITQLVPGE